MYAPPDKIGHRVRQVFDWLNGPEPKKLKDPVRIAARVHYDLLRIFPFPQDSGKVARLLMNLLLIRADLPPVIIHSTERQRYSDALKGSLPTIVTMVNDSMRNALTSIEKVLDEEELRLQSLGETLESVTDSKPTRTPASSLNGGAEASAEEESSSAPEPAQDEARGEGALAGEESRPASDYEDDTFEETDFDDSATEDSDASSDDNDFDEAY